MNDVILSNKLILKKYNIVNGFYAGINNTYILVVILIFMKIHFLFYPLEEYWLTQKTLKKN